jgi:hypothetical protein
MSAKVTTKRTSLMHPQKSFEALLLAYNLPIEQLKPGSFHAAV